REQAVGDRSARDRGSDLPELAAGHRLDRPGEEAARRLLAERPELTLEGDAHCRTCVAHVRTPAPSGSGCPGAATNASACSARSREQAVGDRSARDRGSDLPELAAGHRLDRPGEEAARRLLAERPELTLEGDAHCRTCVAHVRTPAPSGSGCSGAATNASACSA